jgi:hypothetical protein
MNPLTRFPLRKIAEHTLAKYLGDLDAGLRDELATSLVRQWVTNDGHAGFVTPTHKFWFQMVLKGEGVEVGFNPVEGKWAHYLSERWHVDEGEIPGLLHQLNLCQSVLCRNADGHRIRLRVEPKERTVRCQEETEAEETDR